MERGYLPEAHHPVRPYSVPLDRSGVPGSCSDPACHFGRFSVAECTPNSYAIERPPLFLDQQYYGSLFPPPGWVSVMMHPPADCQARPDGGALYHYGVSGLLGGSQPVCPRVVTHAGTFASQSPSSDKTEPVERICDRGSVGKKRRRPRLVINDKMKKVLEASFQNNNYLSYEERQRLSYCLSIREGQIAVWFQNRRTKQRKMQICAEQPTNDRISAGYAGTHRATDVLQPPSEPSSSCGIVPAEQVGGSARSST